MSLLTSTIPSHDGYVAAAYIVFFALILIYVAIMAVRLSRVERKLNDMQRAREDVPETISPAAPPAAGTDAAQAQRAEADGQERELV